MEIRLEAASDWPIIARLNRDAFGGEYEADLIQHLRDDGLVAAALVAIVGQQIVGHVVFSWLPVTRDGTPVKALALGPIAVREDQRGEGIGQALINHGIRAGRADGAEAVFVLGDPEYYQRFGFRRALAARFNAPFDEDAFMALELVPGALSCERGEVVYPAAWGLNTPGPIS